jgi:hypothetical protein
MVGLGSWLSRGVPTIPCSLMIAKSPPKREDVSSMKQGGISMEACCVHERGLRLAHRADLQRPCSGVVNSVIEPRPFVAEPVESFAACEGKVRVLAIVDLGESVEYGPDVPGLELAVARLTPFVDHIRHLARSDGSACHGADNEVMHRPVGDCKVTVGVGALVEAAELSTEPTGDPGVL